MNGSICSIMGASPRDPQDVDGAFDPTPQAPFLYYGLTGFVIDPVEENRHFLMMVDEDFQRFFYYKMVFFVYKKLKKVPMPSRLFGTFH